jgi:hypothetical protein
VVRTSARLLALALVLSSLPWSAFAADPPARSTIAIGRTDGAIAIDGDLSDAGWQSAAPIETWYEIDPGTNLEPKVKSVARITYDDRALYVAFELSDPDPGAIRAPVTDRDNALTSSDYAGIVIDGRNDGKTAQEFLANPRGVQYDAIWSDIAGEDLAPNFYWESAAKIGATGWTLELRIPFSSIRYDPVDAPVWGVTLFRNYPRAFRYQLATALQPEDAPCFICNENQLTGLAGLPSASSLVFAPYGIARQDEFPAGGVPGAPLESDDVEGAVGFDLKWAPNARHTIDLAVNPDFSQVESDVAQIATNQRFALFFPEQRPFFLEQIDLFSTPMPAVYTRTVTEPRAGLRATGRFGKNAYTLLVAEDRGGGSVVIPSDTFSSFAEQDFESQVLLGRLRHDFGQSFLSFLVSGRKIDGGGDNQVFGPDFQWQPRSSDTVAGQLLWSRSETPVRPDLADEWDGRELDGTAAYLRWQHDDGRWDSYLEGQDIDADFRADNGFVPQVGFQQGLIELGRSWDGRGAISKFRLFTFDQYATDEDDDVLTRIVSGGFELRGARDLRLRLRYTQDEQQVEGQLLEQNQVRLRVALAPSATFARLALWTYFGEAIDYDNAREGDGTGVQIEAILRSPEHLEIKLNAERNLLDVEVPGVSGERLFTADLARARVTYTFTPRCYLRAVVQWVETERDPELYTFPVEAEESDLQTSLLLAYKWNWQSVVYLGYGDVETYLPSTKQREKASREIFLKLSWAFQK